RRRSDPEAVRHAARAAAARSAPVVLGVVPPEDARGDAGPLPGGHGSERLLSDGDDALGGGRVVSYERRTEPGVVLSKRARAPVLLGARARHRARDPRELQKPDRVREPRDGGARLHRVVEPPRSRRLRRVFETRSRLRLAVTPALAAVIFGAGALAGTLGALVGIGGGVFLVPLLNLALGFPFPI